MISSPHSRPWMQTRRRHRFYFDDPGEGVIDIRDIAAGVAKECRFNGQCDGFYTVAEHSITVSRVVEERHNDPTLTLAALLHDASEAYLRDIPTPHKTCGDMATYRERESRTQDAIERRFHLPRGLTRDERIKAADWDCLAVEARLLMAPLDPAWEAWLVGTKPVEIKISRYPWDVAERLFLQRFREIRDAQSRS